MNYHRGLCLVIMTFVTGLALVIPPNFGQTREEQRKSSAIQKVKRLPEISLSVDNSEGSGLLIQSATVKEIDGRQFQQLTRKVSQIERYISFPTIRLVNNTNKTIAAFTVGLRNLRSHEDGLFRRSRLSLQPGQEVIIEPLVWANTRKIAAHPYIKKGDTTEEDKSPADWDFEGAWVQGGVAEFSVCVAQINFADGSQWLTSKR